MAKRRLINPEIWTDEKFVQLDPLTRLLFIGMWNFACDNGHLDDSPLQLKMRILPADPCDTKPLLDQLVTAGMVDRAEGYLKVVNLAHKQTLDMRYLVLCGHCENDEHTKYAAADKATKKTPPSEATTSAPRGHNVRTWGAQSKGGGGGDGDGDGFTPPASPKRKHQLPKGWEPKDTHQTKADTAGLNLPEQFVAFADYHLGKGSTYLDWDRAFNTWLTNAKKFADRDSPNKTGKPDNRQMPAAWR